MQIAGACAVIGRRVFAALYTKQKKIIIKIGRVKKKK